MTLDALTISGNIGLPPDNCITVQYQTIKQKCFMYNKSARI